MLRVVYEIRNLDTGGFYIGSAQDFSRRRWEHLSLLKKGKHHCCLLQEAYDVHGLDVFEFSVLQEARHDQDLLALEDIFLHRHAGNPLCYNTSFTTTSPPSYTDETRKKISETLRARFADPTKHPHYGKPNSPETRAKISANRKGKMAGEAHYRFGQTVSPEVREKIGAAQRGVKKGPRTFTPEGRVRAQENMRKNAREQVPVAFAEVHAKFPVEVQQRYDFSKAVYTGALARITGCVCAEHGEFSQYAAQFRKGRGCPECGAVQRAERKSAQMKEEWAAKKAGLPAAPVV